MSADEEEAQSFVGHYMDGKTASMVDVRIVVHSAALHALTGDEAQEVQVWPLAGLVCERLPGGGSVELRHADVPGALITTSDAHWPEALRSAGVAVAGLPQGPRLIKLLLINFAAVAAVIATGYISLPYLATAIAKRIPLRMEARLGDQVDVLLEKSYCESAEAARALEELRLRIEGPHSPPRALRVLDLEAPNAFTFPGGWIVLTRGLLEEAESPDEVAGILAHEIQHVEQRHVLSHVIRGALLSAAWAVTVGDFTGILVVDPSTAFQIANLRFSRADEQSADQAAVFALDRAGIPRDGMVRFFERLKSKSDVVPEWLSTHPTSERRARELAGPTGSGATKPVLADSLWQALKDACKTSPASDSRSLREIILGR